MKKTAAALSASVAVAASLGLIAAPAAQAEEFDLCPSGMSGVVTDDTSCVFADNVRYSWYAQPGGIITAFSPKTQKTYVMQCSRTYVEGWSSAKRCVGVNDSGAGLIVVIS